ncbi:MAG: hypothetical protein RL398_50 [Planctomycetota bacterium]
MGRSFRTADRFLLAAWAASLLGGLGALIHHGTTPGAVGDVPEAMPEALGQRLGAEDGRPLVVLCAHPQCPCLPSTLTELQRVLATAPAHRIGILAYTPEATVAGWDAERTATLREALPTARLVPDHGGRLAKQLGAQTSGHVLVYGADGSLRFSGGVTAGRGHVGDNAGARAFARAVAGSSDPRETTHIFGCPLDADTGNDGNRGSDSF